MNKLRIIAVFAFTAAAIFTAAAVAQANSAAPSIHAWTGVWQVKETNKPGVTITLAEDDGKLAGTIVFDIYKAQTNEHIATEPRAVVNPHMEGNMLAFEVKRILKPHLKGDAPDTAADATDIVEMTLTPGADGNATLNCAKCGSNAPTELVKAQ